MVAGDSLPRHSRWRLRSAAVVPVPVAVLGGPESIELVGWVAGGFMVVAVAATLYLAFVGTGAEQHRPAGTGSEGDPGDEGGPAADEHEGRAGGDASLDADALDADG